MQIGDHSVDRRRKHHGPGTYSTRRAVKSSAPQITGLLDRPDHALICRDFTKAGRKVIPLPIVLAKFPNLRTISGPGEHSFTPRDRNAFLRKRQMAGRRRANSLGIQNGFNRLPVKNATFFLNPRHKRPVPKACLIINAIPIRRALNHQPCSVGGPELFGLAKLMRQSFTLQRRGIFDHQTPRLPKFSLPVVVADRRRPIHKFMGQGEQHFQSHSGLLLAD